MQQRIKRALHYWLSIPGVVFFLFWIISGIALVWDSIRGGLHMFPNPPAAGDLRDVSFSLDRYLKNSSEPVSKLTLFLVGNHPYVEAIHEKKKLLLDASTGRLLTPIDQKTATVLLSSMGGSIPKSVSRVTSRSYEYKYGELPAWRGEFADERIIHISESTGSPQSWSDRTGMIVRAMYFYGHAFQFTDSGRLNAAVGFFAILWAIASVVSGLLLYSKKRNNAALLLVFLLLPCWVNAAPELKVPRRIVSLAPSCAEIVAGLGLQDKLVGITAYTDYPPEIVNLPQVGSYVEPNLEVILSLQPDLVVATDDGNPEDILQRLRELSVPVVVLNLRSYDRIRQSILQLGSLMGRKPEAERLSTQMAKVANCIRDRTRNSERPTVLFSYQSYPFVTAGKGTFTDELVEMAGGRLITHNVPLSYPRMTIESVLAEDPDVIIESTMDPSAVKADKLEWWKQYSMLRAVKNNRVFILNSRHLDRPSQNIVSGFVELARTIHPDLFANNECMQ